MLEVLHDGGLFQEVLQCHVLFFQRLDGHDAPVTLPDGFVHVTVLTTTCNVRVRMRVGMTEQSIDDITFATRKSLSIIF